MIALIVTFSILFVAACGAVYWDIRNEDRQRRERNLERERERQRARNEAHQLNVSTIWND